MNDQDGRDYSIWSGFFAAETVFASKAVIKQMIEDLKQELKDRPFQVTPEYMAWCSENGHEADNPDTHEIYMESVNDTQRTETGNN